MAIGENPGGACARHVDVLRVDRVDGGPMAVWMCHPAHAVALDHNNTLISADWPGYARRALEADYPGATAMFAQGCCGNINCNWRFGFDVTERLGLMFAEAVRKVADGLTPAATAQVRVAAETVALPLQDPPPPAEARAAGYTFDDLVEKLRSHIKPEQAPLPSPGGPEIGCFRF